MNFEGTPKAREVAQRLIQAFLDGENIDAVPTDDAGVTLELAKTIARNSAAIIIHHARAAQQHGGLDRTPKSLKLMVGRYLETRRRTPR